MGELVFDFNFSPDEPDEKIINSFSDIINEKDLNIAYLKKISCESISYEFNAGISLLKSFVTRRIDKVKIRIDLSERIFANNTIACYHPGLSNSKNFLNEPYFSVSKVMLRESLTSYFSNSISSNNIFIWAHEIIHWLDDSLKKYNEETLFSTSKSSAKRFLFQMFKYRKEGLAVLCDIFIRGNFINSMESAREEFAAEIKRVFEIPPSRKLHPKYALQKLDKSACYKIGPWMILHVLSCPENRDRFPGTEEVLLKQKNHEAFDSLELPAILESGLKIDNYTFLKYLTKPGVDCHPFITGDQMRLIRKTMKTIPNGRDDIEYFEKKYPEESGSIIKIIEFYNWFGHE
jgi:hypothetical protein